LIVGTAVAGAAVTLLAGPASAAATPRLAGTWVTKQKVTSSRNGEPVGKTNTKPYKFVPKCGAGACATVVTRLHGDGSKQTYTLQPVAGKAQYAGTTKYVSSCYTSKGGVLISRGYTYSEKLTINVTKSSAGAATGYSGVLSLTFTPTAAGKNKCPAGTETVALTSGKKTG
jgi:hypothetical protein